ncbi:MtrAB system accessory lipoprotein LpqB [Rhodococcus daqingensis]|uniref:Lipoprotein LpqB n=1 Tax=Rhodococcus daqingensis TaxID=2479363 RepID=A0ABW2RUV5_9NOCA
MKVSIVAALAAVFVLAGCASLPDSSTPQAIGTIAPSPVTGEVPVPTPGREPNLLLRDFFGASTDPVNRHHAARQFLTPAAADRWDDGASMTIVDKVDVLQDERNGDRASFTIRANKVGQLEPGGSYLATEGSFEAKIQLRRIDGQWRIDELPPGVIMDRPQFLKSYQRNALYFLDPGEAAVVPDLRWISARQENLPERLVDLLITGPKPVLANAVGNQLGNLSAAPITKADGRAEGVGTGFGGVRIDFQGAAGLDQRRRELLAAQVVWTLAAAEISGPYVLLADGKPLDERFPQGWTTADVASTNPTASASAGVGLHALRDGALVTVTDTGVLPRPGYFGSATSLESIALSRDGKWAAGVSTTGHGPETVRTLMGGPIDGDAVPLLKGGAITRPTWSPGDGSVWAVVDGTQVIRADRDPNSGQMSVQPVDSAATAGLGGAITEFRLSRDGVRAAMIVDGRVYVAVVERNPDGRYQLMHPRPAAVGLGSPALALDWSGGDSVVVVRAASEIPVVVVSQDGSRMDALPSRNLTPPVDSADASPTTVFVGDERGVFQLNNNDPAGDRYWREVPGLTGVKATPVLPG